MQSFVKNIIHFLTEASAILLPVMITAFFAAIVLRLLVHYTVTRELWFAKEFYKRVHKSLDDEKFKSKGQSFYVYMKRCLENTYYELFVVRAHMKRRNPDIVMDFSDRVFLIQNGSARLVKETLRQVKHLRYQKERPRFLEITKNVFDNNPNFKKIMGIIPVQATHDVLSVLPGIFTIGGIFGTFIGIMGALPTLNEMDLTNVEQANEVMGNFLDNIAFSMSTSIIGIILSVSMTFLNTLFDPEKVFMKTVNKFENTMELLWDCCENNSLPENIPDFDEHRDPIEALAENAVDNEVGGDVRVLNSKDFDDVSRDTPPEETPEQKAS